MQKSHGLYAIVHHPHINKRYKSSFNMDDFKSFKPDIIEDNMDYIRKKGSQFYENVSNDASNHIKSEIFNLLESLTKNCKQKDTITISVKIGPASVSITRVLDDNPLERE